MAQYSAEFKQAKVLVLGDVMLDRYWFGATNRISPEAPVPVVRVQENEERAGGAANVAMNIASLNVPVQLMGLIGQDETGSALSHLLEKQKTPSISTALFSPEILAFLARRGNLAKYFMSSLSYFAPYW